MCELINNNNEFTDPLLPSMPSLEEDGTKLFQNQQQIQIDCTNIVDSLRGEFSKRSAEQQIQIDKLVSSVNILITKLNSDEGSSRPNADKALPTTTETQEETGFQEGSSSSITGNNVNMTPPGSADAEVMSVQGSNVWFRSVVNQTSGSTAASRSQRSTPSNCKSGDGDDAKLLPVDEVEEPSQNYWQDAVEEYESTSQASGPEVLSSIASASKIFWHRSLKQEILKKKLEDASTPSNCDFLLPKKVNTEIWTKMGPFNRTADFKLQEAQVTHSAATTKMLRAASALTEMFKENMPRQVKEALTDLKESMTLAGKLSQQLNQARRDMIKPTLSRDYKKLASETDETSRLLFGENLCERMEKLKKESKLCNMLAHHDSNSGKRKYEESKNSNPSPKTQRKVVYGQKYEEKENSKEYHKEKKSNQKSNYKSSKNYKKRN